MSDGNRLRSALVRTACLEASLVALPIEVLLEVVSFTDVVSAIKMTRVSALITVEIFENQKSINRRRAFRLASLSTRYKKVSLSGYYYYTPSSLSGPFPDLRGKAPLTMSARL